MDNLSDVLLLQLKDLYSAENQLIVALPYMIEGASDRSLSKALLEHLAETEEQIERLDSISTIIGKKLSGHECKAMRGLIKEGAEALEGDYLIPGFKDVMIVAAAQRVEHYEIAAYGNAIALAEYLEMSDVAALLQESIQEEGDADRALTALCQSRLFDACDDGDREKVIGEAQM